MKVFLLSCLPYLAYLGITKIGYYFLHAHFNPIRGKPVLYLRVFGYSRRASRLADLLRARWRYSGSLRLIAARDLAGRAITPVMLRAFLLRRLREFFIETQGALERRIASLRTRRDPDGSFRTELLFCNGGSWRETVVDRHVFLASSYGGYAEAIASLLARFGEGLIAKDGLVLEGETLLASEYAAWTARLRTAPKQPE